MDNSSNSSNSSSELIPTLEDLKNPEASEIITGEITDVEEENHLDYKKKLNKKVSEFTEEEKQKYNKLAQKKKRVKEKNEEEINNEKLDEEKKTHLYNQLFVLKQKFPENLENIHINNDMNYKTLNEKKDLIMTLITQKNSHNVVFETLLLMARTGERGLDYFDIDALNGYTENLNDAKDDIVPILKEMIDTGEIDCSMMTPQLRLMIVMSSVAVKTVERNNDKKKNAIVVRELSPGTGGEEER